MLSRRNDHSTALPTIRSPSYAANSSCRSPLSVERNAPRNSPNSQNGASGRPKSSARRLSVVELAHHRVVGQRRIVEHADLHD